MTLPTSPYSTLRLEQVKRKALDEEMAAVLRNNPPDVSRPTFVRRLLEETIKQYQRDSSLQNIIMTNAEDLRYLHRPRFDCAQRADAKLRFDGRRAIVVDQPASNVTHFNDVGRCGLRPTLQAGPNPSHNCGTNRRIGGKALKERGCVVIGQCVKDGTVQADTDIDRAIQRRTRSNTELACMLLICVLFRTNDATGAKLPGAQHLRLAALVHRRGFDDLCFGQPTAQQAREVSSSLRPALGRTLRRLSWLRRTEAAEGHQVAKTSKRPSSLKCPDLTVLNVQAVLHLD